ncbi:cadherin-like domain-containing protein, partial [Rubripirellula amarantea]|nr:cadherin-like domain-containing protein [Rubripirellula amarantea]
MAVNDEFGFPESPEIFEDDVSVTLNVLANDEDADGDIVPSLTVQLPLPSVNRGSLTNNNDGTFTFFLNDDFEDLAEGEVATETFEYRVEDATGGTATATVAITVTGVNDAAEIVEASNVPAIESGVGVVGANATGNLDHSDVDNYDDIWVAATLTN